MTTYLPLQSPSGHDLNTGRYFQYPDLSAQDGEADPKRDVEASSDKKGDEYRSELGKENHYPGGSAEATMIVSSGAANNNMQPRRAMDNHGIYVNVDSDKTPQLTGRLRGIANSVSPVESSARAGNDQGTINQLSERSTLLSPFVPGASTFTSHYHQNDKSATSVSIEGQASLQTPPARSETYAARETYETPAHSVAPSSRATPSTYSSAMVDQSNHQSHSSESQRGPQSYSHLQQNHQRQFSNTAGYAMQDNTPHSSLHQKEPRHPSTISTADFNHFQAYTPGPGQHPGSAHVMYYHPAMSGPGGHSMVPQTMTNGVPSQVFYPPQYQAVGQSAYPHKIVSNSHMGAQQLGDRPLARSISLQQLNETLPPPPPGVVFARSTTTKVSRPKIKLTHEDKRRIVEIARSNTNLRQEDIAQQYG